MYPINENSARIFSSLCLTDMEINEMEISMKKFPGWPIWELPEIPWNLVRRFHKSISELFEAWKDENVLRQSLTESTINSKSWNNFLFFPNAFQPLDHNHSFLWPETFLLFCNLNLLLLRDFNFISSPLPLPLLCFAKITLGFFH